MSLLKHTSISSTVLVAKDSDFGSSGFGTLGVTRL